MTQAQALKILKTGANVFLTGEPGSGKTFVTNQYTQYLKTHKVGVAVTASTGIAATHIGGMTVHSWSGIGIKRNLSEYDVDRITANERIAKRVERTSVLIIDEVSMLSGELLNGIDRICREVKRSREPFGGIQIIFVGDFFQLPPVSEIGKPGSQFAFQSIAWGNLKPIVCYLSEQHRQEDDMFLDILTALRKNKILEIHKENLRKRCQQTPAFSRRTMTKLFSHNEDVDNLNQAELERLFGEPKHYDMLFSGKEFLVKQLKKGCLSPERLSVKKDALVMFTKNSPKGEFVNGTLGTVIGFAQKSNFPIVRTKKGRKVEVEMMDWTIEENNKIIAKISQVPLRLAWAITVHKSQGMSLDSAYIDLREAFVEGQGYVALSRVRSLSGIYLEGWNDMALRVHAEVLARDVEFRTESDDAKRIFEKLTPGEITKMHQNFIIARGGSQDSKTYSIEKIRDEHPNAYKGWRKEEDESLMAYFQKGNNTKTISNIMGRRPGAIRSRLAKLGLVK